MPEQANKGLERCYLCDEPTGRAGAGEDSIFIDTPHGRIGPLCEKCRDGILTGERLLMGLVENVPGPAVPGQHVETGKRPKPQYFTGKHENVEYLIAVQDGDGIRRIMARCPLEADRDMLMAALEIQRLAGEREKEIAEFSRFPVFR